MSESHFLNRVVLTDFKSIGHCDVSLARPRTILVGPNDSGKSNFLDGLGFLADSLRVSLEYALRCRGGFAEIRCRTRDAERVGVRLDASLGGASFRYAFTIGQAGSGDARVLREDCSVTGAGPMRQETFYSVKGGRMARSNIQSPPVASPHQLYLIRAAAIAEFRPLFDAVAGMRFYNFNPTEMRKMQPPGLDSVLRRDGGNAATVLHALGNRLPDLKRRLDEYLGVIAPGIGSVSHKVIGNMETIEFQQNPESIDNPVVFHAANMSDGVLRALGLLLAVFQCAGEDATTPRLIGIEEPELALHPNAIEILADVLDEAAIHTQLVIACHSSDLLDRTELPADSIFACENRRGITHIGPIDASEIRVIRNRVHTPGELMRMNLLQLSPPAFQPGPPSAQLFDLDT